MQAVIIDDEPRAHEVLRGLLKQSSIDVEITSGAKNVHDGVQLLQTQSPDIVFLDIDMPDGTGFDLLDQIDTDHTRIIFTTAHDEFALKAFKYNAVDYLLKPIDPDDLEIALNKVQKANLFNGYSKQINNLISDIRSKQVSKLAISSLNEIQYIFLDSIVYLEADGNYTSINLSDGRKLVVPKTLKEYDDLLPADRFFRTHQSYIIQGKNVCKFKKDESLIELTSGDTIPVSRRKRHDLISWLNDQ